MRKAETFEMLASNLDERSVHREDIGSGQLQGKLQPLHQILGEKKGVFYPCLFRTCFDAVPYNVQLLVLVISVPCHLHDL